MCLRLLCLLLAGLSLQATMARAQVKQPKRVELKLEENDGYYTLISAQEQGLVLFNELNGRRDGNFHLQIMRLDTALNKVWDWTYSGPSSMVFTGYDLDQGKLHLMFGKGYYTPKEYQIISIDLESKDTVSHVAKRIIPIELTDFIVNGETALFVGMVNFKPAVMHYDFRTAKSTVLPGIYSNQGELVDLSLDKERNLINVIISERDYNRNFTFNIKTFDEGGELVNATRLRPEVNYSLLSGTTTTLDNGDQMIIGTYSERRSTYSRGIFMARIRDGKQEQIHFYNYADLDNFFTYMRDRREERVQRRIARKREKGKDPKFNYRLMVHEIIERGDEYILVGEAYYPRYLAPYPYFAGLNSDWATRRAYQGRDINFDGYRYTHAVVMGFDAAGDLRWDNSFEINDVVSYDLTRYVSINPRQEEIVLLYNYEDVLQSKVISRDEVLNGKTSEEIRLAFDNDQLRESEVNDSGLEYWYGDYFYAFGVQKIKNLQDTDVGLNREVFYINKITYD